MFPVRGESTRYVRGKRCVKKRTPALLEFETGSGSLYGRGLRICLGLALTVSLSYSLASCSKKASTETPETSQEKNDATTGATTDFYHANKEAVDSLSSVKSLAELINDKEIPDKEIICIVGDDAINVGDYKREYQARQTTVRQYLQLHPEQAAPLLQKAKEEGITLTEEERKKLVESAHKMVQSGNKLDSSAFAKKLKEHNTTEAEFDKEVAEMGLALKVSNRGVEKDLIKKLISNSMLIDGARKEGLGKKAYNRYFEFKKSPKYESLQTFAEMTPGQLKDWLIENFLVEEMTNRLTQTATVSDKEAHAFYVENKDKFARPAMVTWSQIVIAAPEVDNGPIQSVRTQVKRQMPGLTEAQLDEEVKKAEAAQKETAENLLKKALSGEDFAKLANENTNDWKAKADANGGNMGSMPLDEIKNSDLLSTLAEPLEKTSAGKVYPSLVRTKFGYHILKVNDKKAAGAADFKEVKDELKQLLGQQSSALAVNKWLLEQQRKIPIKIAPRFEELIKNAPKELPKG